MKTLVVLMGTFVFVGTLSAGCKSKGSPGKAKALAAWFAKEARRVPPEPCTRAPLRGSALAGSGTKALADLLDRHQTTDCMYVGKMDSVQHGLYVANFGEDYVLLEESKHDRRVARGAHHPISTLKMSRSLAKRCRKKIARMRRAVQHGSACAPHRPGHQGPGHLRDLDPLITGVRYEARRLARAGDWKGAFELVLDGLRFTQDLARGGIGHGYHLQVSRSGTRLALELEALLNTHQAIPVALLTQVERELGRLLDTEPSLHTYLRGGLLGLAYEELLPAAMPGGWTPPGGWGARESYDGPRNQSKERWALEAIRPLFAVIAKACPRAQPATRCLAAVDRIIAERTPGMKRDPVALLEQVPKLMAKSSSDGVPVFQASILAMLRHRMMELYLRPFLLGALRLRVAYRRIAEKARRCPGRAIFATPELKKLRTDPVSGRPYRLLEREPGRVRIQWPKGVPHKRKAKPVALLRCSY